MLSNLLEKHGINYEDLNSSEKETLAQWQQLLIKNELTLQSVKEFVPSLIEGIERELADVKESTSLWSFLFRRKQDIFLKARLKNYLMLQDFLTSADRARKHIEQSLTNINK